MKMRKGADILLNVMLPVVLGLLIYFFAGSSAIWPALWNYGPDGLWAYSFISAILIIWERKCHPFWIATAFLVSICFEYLQYAGFISGTGDLFDVLTYCLFFYGSLKLNAYFKNANQNQKFDHA
jgi:hypothetical protein